MYTKSFRIFLCVILSLIWSVSYAEEQSVLEGNKSCEKVRAQEPRGNPQYDWLKEKAARYYSGVLVSGVKVGSINKDEIHGELLGAVDDLIDKKYSNYIKIWNEKAGEELSNAARQAAQMGGFTTSQMDKSVECVLYEALANPESDSASYLLSELQFIKESADSDITRINDRKQIELANKERANPTSNTMNTLSFKVTANSCTAATSLGGKILVASTDQPGNKFIILDSTWMNTATDSRRIEPGALLVDYQGKTYQFDSYERVIDPEYSLPPQAVNPMVSYRLKLAFRVPSELKGKVRWQPGGNPSNKTVACGSI